MQIKYFLLPLLVLFFASCSYQSVKKTYDQNRDINVFIQMPDNVLVFDNLSPVIYKKIHNHFHRVGYTLTNNEENAFSLKVKIKNVDNSQKFISPDILLYDLRMRLELQCKLFDKNKKLLEEKTFYFYSLISKPSNPILASKFFELAYKDLGKKAAPKIEQYFRKFFKRPKGL